MNTYIYNETEVEFVIVRHFISCENETFLIKLENKQVINLIGNNLKRCALHKPNLQYSIGNFSAVRWVF